MTCLPVWKVAPGLALTAWLLLAPLPVRAQTAEPKGPDLSEFKTVETAITTKISKAGAT